MPRPATGMGKTCDGYISRKTNLFQNFITFAVIFTGL